MSIPIESIDDVPHAQRRGNAIRKIFLVTLRGQIRERQYRHGCCVAFLSVRSAGFRRIIGTTDVLRGPLRDLLPAHHQAERYQAGYDGIVKLAACVGGDALAFPYVLCLDNSFGRQFECPGKYQRDR